MSDAGTAGPEAAADNRIFVLILQHPQERREPLATAALTVANLRRGRLAVGLSWPNLERALGRPVDPSRWGVLYLGSVRAAVFGEAGEIIALGRDGQPLRDRQLLRRLDGIVLLDGTWSQAKTLWWRNPWLLKLQRLALNPPRPSRLGRLRREPRREAVSTIEAAALALRHLEAGAGPADVLTQALDGLLAAARRPRQPAPADEPSA